ncbi:XRE family transcriptional regulator [Cryptosporangium phraense]|uniref:XRE family transcriptional regulator n=2 Tax=Cryptosporangium phraense TaxID=2593070 RepID=A0A545ARE3_9ACTN|nr:XRE family transcriptional regulator [Cryptosporangium phraense]
MSTAYDPGPPGQRLAQRLRQLRRSGLSRSITQERLGQLLGGEEPLSAPLISSWERAVNPVVPPPGRIRAYARLFASERSLVHGLQNEDELTPDERERLVDLERELLRLRQEAASTGDAGSAARSGLIYEEPVARKLGSGTWRFDDERPVVLISSELPVADRPDYADESSADYVELYRYADLDAMFELHGHLRATNPENTRIRVRSPNRLTSDDFASHLVLLGGVDLNPVTRDLLRRLDLPIRQVSADVRAEGAYFEVLDDGEQRRFAPIVSLDGESEELREDVAMFYRGPSPLNRRRTVTICNAMYGRGTLGAVRALTDAWFRDRNEQYLTEAFGNADEFLLLVRVPVFAGNTVTPDWTLPDTRLFEWSRSADPEESDL